MNTCFNCLHLSQPNNSIFTSCNCIKRVPEEMFVKRLDKSNTIENDDIEENIDCKYWRDGE